jgi:hypothetical protein
MKKVIQPRLFNWDVAETGMVELFPAVWSAAEAITSPDIDLRLDGLARLEELSAANYSPLVAYLIASRLVDPDLKMRARVIRLLGDVLQSNIADPETVQLIHQHITAYLSQMQTRQLLFILQALAYDPTIEKQVTVVLKECSQAGEYLAGILADRQMPLNIRKHAVCLVGEIGYLEAVSSLEKLQARLEVRAEGQQYMPFHIQEQSEENQLLPEVQKVLVKLQAP